MSHFYADAAKPGLRLISGIVFTSTYRPATGILITPGSVDLEKRLIRAMEVLRTACGATGSSYGF